MLIPLQKLNLLNSQQRSIANQINPLFFVQPTIFMLLLGLFFLDDEVTDLLLGQLRMPFFRSEKRLLGVQLFYIEEGHHLTHSFCILIVSSGRPGEK